MSAQPTYPAFDTIAESLVLFRFEPLKHPEGYMRITLARTYDPDSFDRPVPKNPGERVRHLVTLKKHLITKIPTWKRTRELLFGEATMDGFDLSVYDTPHVSDVLTSPFIYDIGFEAHRRWFSGFVKPFRTTSVYCLIEFMQDGESDYTPMILGKMQESIDGTDNIISHGIAKATATKRTYVQAKAQMLNVDTNYEYDAERIWDLKFIPLSLSAIGDAPIKPAFDDNGLDDGSNYYLPFHTAANGVYPYRPLDLNNPSGPKTEQLVGSGTANLTGTPPRYPRWARHIELGYCLKIMFDYFYGDGKYTFECDDSPFTFVAQSLDGPRVGLEARSVSRTINAGFDVPIEKRILIPMSLFGYWDIQKTDESYHVIPDAPAPQCAYSRRFQSVFEGILDKCYTLGWVPDFYMDHSVDPPLMRIRFKVRTEVVNAYDTLVPVESKPIGFPESEAGISVAAIKSFENTTAGTGWADDWYAKHLNNTFTTVGKVQSNPYIVPETEKNPAKLEISMRFGPESGQNVTLPAPFGNALGWSMAKYDTASGVPVASETEDFPMLGPLIFGEPGADAVITPPNDAAFFWPVVRASFEYTNSQGVVKTVLCDSLRQLLARYYSLFFVRSDSKYQKKYPTNTRFVDRTPGSATLGTESWKHLDLWNTTRTLRVGKNPDAYANGAPRDQTHKDLDTPFQDYLTHSIEMDFDACETTVELLSTQAAKISEIAGEPDFKDSTELTGKEPGAPPDKPGPDPGR